MKSKLNQNVKRKLLNEISSPKNININNNSFSDKNIKNKFNSNNSLISVRVRPLNSKEKEESDYKTIKVISTSKLIISIPTEYSFEENSEINHIKVAKEKQSSFEFDFVFDENSSQSQIYDYTTRNLINNVLEGYNATVLAYGATGTGKTYTMVGNGVNNGIMIRTIKDLFYYVNNNIMDNKQFVIKISFIEIYNETIKDLLSNDNSIVELKTDSKKGLVLKNALIKKVSNENEAFNLIMKGNKNRTEKFTEYNNNSSRSHAILNIYIEIEDQEINLKPNKSFGKFMLLDLAGCEKTSFNNNIKNKELGSINKSLLALNKCINLLVSKNRGFIPWRDSNLTRLLQESLCGNSKLVIIATVSMALDSFDETMFTLNFANKAKNLKLNLKKNIIPTKETGINKYDKFISNIKEEIVEIKKDILKQEGFKDSNERNEINPYVNNKKEEQIKNENKKEAKQENKLDKVYKEMIDHFQLEIKLKKKIIEKENIIEELKNDMAEKEYEILHSNEINLPPLQKQLKEKKEEITDKSNKLLKGYIKQSDLINKRKDFQKVISFLSNNTPNNPEYFKIYNMYKYNINLLENMTIEHKKYMNIQESKRKDKKIEGLMEQIDIRDKCIKDVYELIEKNDIKFNYENPELINRNDIDSFYYKPQSIEIKPPIDHYQSLFKRRKLILKNNNEMNNEEKKISINEGSSEKRLILKKININKNKNDVNESTNNSKSNFKRSSYKNELYAILRSSKNGMSVNDFIRRRKIPKSNEKNSLSSYNLKPSPLSPINKKINLKEIRNNALSVKMSDNKKINYNPNVEIHEINSYKNKSMIMNLETEVQKKIKTILKKNYIARYRRSPFLKILNE